MEYLKNENNDIIRIINYVHENMNMHKNSRFGDYLSPMISLIIDIIIFSYSIMRERREEE